MNTQVLKIRRVPYSRLAKSEMADYAEKATNIVDKYEPSAAQFQPLFEELYAKKRDIHLLRLDYGIDAERLRANKLKEKLNLTISAFKLKVRMIGKSMPDLDMHVLVNPINTHLRRLDKCRNNNMYNQRIGGFFDLFDTSAELQGAVSEHNLTQEVDDMTAAYMEFNESWNKRIKLLSERPVFETKTLIKGLVQSINNLFDAIEVDHHIGTFAVGEPGSEGEVDHVALIDELSQHAEMVRRSIAIREANNKRKANGELEGEGEGEGLGDEGDELTDGEPVDGTQEPEAEPDDSGEGDGEESGEPGESE